MTNNSDPLVSIYIPTRNRPELLFRAIQSCLQQSYPHLEIIVVDDASDAAIQQQLQQHHQQQEQQLAQAVYELVSKLSELTLEAELSLQPAHLQQAINTLLPVLQVNEHISAIRLSPQDLAWWQQLQQTALGTVTLQADSKLATGSAVFVGASQLHLADFRQRLQNLLPQVQQQLLGSHNDGT